MTLLPKLAVAFELTNALAENLSADDLTKRNGAARSNTIGAQFWCVVGARESYARALQAGAWQGFACSLNDIASPRTVRDALSVSGRAALEGAEALQPLNAARESIVIDLMQHEAQHHGQLIRYFYANGLAFPHAFAQRYALD